MKRSTNESWLVLFFLLLASFLGPLDGSIINIILPELTKYFHVDLQMVKWLVLVYLLVITSLLPMAGWLADRYGLRRLLVLGLGIFAGSSLALALSPSIGFMIFMRAVQGLGATLMFATTAALITRIFVRQRGLALGMVGTSVSIALTLGPPLGGALTDYFSWRTVFLVNVPLGILAIAGILMKVRAQPRVTVEGADRGVAVKASLPALNTASFAIAVGSLVLWLSWLAEPPAPPFAGLERLLPWCFFVFGGLFALLEMQRKGSLIDYSLFRIRDFTVSALTGVVQFVNTFIALFLLPFVIIVYLGYQARVAGLLMASIPVANTVMAPIAGYLSDRIGYRFLTCAGLVVRASGFFLLLLVVKGAPVGVLVVVLAVLGIGAGIFGAPNTSSLMGATPKDKLGTGSAIIAFARNLGMLIGVSAAALLLAWREGHYQTVLGLGALSGRALHESQAFILAFHDIAIIAGCLALLAAVISSFRSK